METPYQTPPAIPFDPAWQEKRKFWGWSIAISAILTVATPVGLVLYGMLGMQGAFKQLGTSGADVGGLANHIGEVLVAASIGSVGGLIAFVWMVISIVRFCTLPKYAAPHVGGQQ